MLFVAVVAATACFFTLAYGDPASESEGLKGPGQTLFTVFQQLVLLSLDPDPFQELKYAVVAQIIFVISSILVPIILLNLLIGNGCFVSCDEAC